MGWKEKIEQEQERRKKREEKRKERVRKRDEAEAERFARKWRREHPRFRCHVCNLESDFAGIPPTYVEQQCGNSSWGYDYDKPADLRKCSRCGKWTCDDCMHLGVCKKCGERLYKSTTT